MPKQFLANSGSFIIPRAVIQDLEAIKSGIALVKEFDSNIQTGLAALERSLAQTGSSATLIKKSLLARANNKPATGRGAVSSQCARFLGAVAVVGAARLGRLDHLGAQLKAEVLRACEAAIPEEHRTALTSTEVPMPETYGKELVQLVAGYGAARRYGTVMPIGANQKLPRLKSSPGFGFVDMSAAVTEKSPQIEFVDFDPEKAGGVIRIPAEIDADSLVEIGQFIAGYCTREMARWEDTVFFLADGTAPYLGNVGLLKQAVNLGRYVMLPNTKTAPYDTTLADLRAMRAKVDSAALAKAAYYFHPTHEVLFTSFNLPQHVPFLAGSKGQAAPLPLPVFVAAGPAGPATLDGYPIRWVDVLPPYELEARPGQLQGLFGDAEYGYLGTRGDFSLMVSKDVFFATDELAVRALERISVGQMADASVAALKLAEN